jgi:hypothetical protein
MVLLSTRSFNSKQILFEIQLDASKRGLRNSRNKVYTSGLSRRQNVWRKALERTLKLTKESAAAEEEEDDYDDDDDNDQAYDDDRSRQQSHQQR